MENKNPPKKPDSDLSAACLAARKPKPAATGQAESARAAGAYTPKPDFSSHDDQLPKRKRGLLAAIVAGAIAITAALLVTNYGTKAPVLPQTNIQMSSTVQAKNIFFVSDRDLDMEATEKAKAALKQGRIPPSLANAPERTRQELLSGEQSLYSVRLLDFADEDGDAVKILLNDVPFGDLVLSNLGAKLTIPLKKGVTTKITCLATVDGGGGGVTFRAISSSGELRTRVMAVGESESWTISFK